LFIDALTTSRITQVDACGAPVTGQNGFVSDCWASISMSTVVDEQDDRIYRAPNGTICAVKRGCVTPLGLDVEINMQQISPEAVEIMTGNPVVMDNLAAVSGFDDCVINCDTGFALEMWATLLGQPCTTTGAQQYLYVLLPWITNARLGDLEFNDGNLDVTVSGSTRAAGNWGTGPYDVVLNGAAPGTPGPMLTPLGPACHRRIQTTTVAPPAASCTYAAVPAVP
jgi:hypothetical protein